jgi:hypothetical protein
VTGALSQEDFDFRWVPPNLLAATRRYECAREAVIQAGLVLPEKRHPDPMLHKIADHYNWERILKTPVFGPIWHLRFIEPGPAEFPHTPFKLVLPKLEDPEEFLRSLKDIWSHFHHERDYVSIDVPVGLSQDEAIEYFRKEYIRVGACSKRGAGASVRRDRIFLKYLSSTRILDYLRRCEGLQEEEPLYSRRARRALWSKLVADAKALSAEVLGEPLLNSDQEWDKAERFTLGALAQFQPEIEWLRELFSHDPPQLLTEPRSAGEIEWIREIVLRLSRYLDSNPQD